ncbi:MAG TPA: DUF349 domain-containing protein [Bacteroidales bacterium]|nr:DUF349 domain-containing protein [Bacteroidales bacterium]
MDNQDYLNHDLLPKGSELQGNPEDSSLENIAAEEVESKQSNEETIEPENKTMVDNENQPQPEKTEIIDSVNEAQFEPLPEFDADLSENQLDENDSELMKAEPEEIDYSAYTKQELLHLLKQLIYEKPVNAIKLEIDSIKKAYYRCRQNEIVLLKKQFVDKGGIAETFEIPRDTDEDYFKELLNDYKARKSVYNEQIEKEKQENLVLKKQIIEKIGLLANRDESLARTYDEFRDLQKQWKEIGLVPQADMQNILNSYQMQIEKFYDFIKIDKELRDLDLKKNLDLKIELCNKAESLLIDPDVVEAYKKLQEYHQQWKELGPVPADKREEVWERFQVATRQINKNHQDYFLKIKEELENNLRQKEIVCEQAEALLLEPCDTIAQWEEISKKFTELQSIWKSIGMVPRKNNATVYERFRAACNTFFENKKQFFSQIRDEQNNNLQRKIELCIQAESIKESTDWKKTTNDFLLLQKQWKEIGPVPRRQSQEIWLRFRKACDSFFITKQNYFANIDNEYTTNLNLKQSLINEVTSFSDTGSNSGNLEKLREFQNRWIEIGQVPHKEKERLQKDFRNAINELYTRLNIQKQSLDVEGFKQRIQILVDTGNIDGLRRERANIIQKQKTLDIEITQLENNMSFFSSKAESLLIDVKRKIEKAKAEMEQLAEQKKTVDLAERELRSKIEKKA